MFIRFMKFVVVVCVIEVALLLVVVEDNKMSFQVLIVSSKKCMTKNKVSIIANINSDGYRTAIGCSIYSILRN